MRPNLTHATTLIEASVGPAFTFKDPRVLPIVEVIVISSSNESKGCVPCNYISDDKYKGYYPFWDRYEQMRDEKQSQSIGYTPFCVRK